MFVLFFENYFYTQVSAFTVEVQNGKILVAKN